MAEALQSRLAGFNPFGKSTKSKTVIDDDDVGEEIGSQTIAGGGHSSRQTGITKNQLRVSNALKTFLIEKNVISSDDADSSLQYLLNEPHINVPAALTDRSHPLPEYFISSSHNTYLGGHQLVGTSSAEAYETALLTGSRCVEIDAWDDDDNSEEPKVTHGYTLVSRITFRSVCEIIRDVHDRESAEASDEQGYRAAPILISLENHCGEHGQLRLVQIMRDVFGERLLSEAVREKGTEEQEGGQHVTLAELGSKIVVIVEHHLPNEAADSDSSSSSEEDEDEKAYKREKKAAPTTIIVPELAELGVYAQSVKPSDNSWFEEVSLRNSPHHHLINVSELGLAAHLPIHASKIAKHNSQHLMRVFPKGTRISSKNLNPVPFWGVGAQVCALNWQTFGAGMQVNEALFSGSDGYVLKPLPLRAGGNGVLDTGLKKRLRLQIAGATDVPVPSSHEEGEIKPYLTCSLLHPSSSPSNAPGGQKKKTSPYKQHKTSAFLHRGENPPVTEPVWDETLEWEYEDNEMVFLRLLVKSDDSFARNSVLAVGCVRVSYLVLGEWRFVRLLDLGGRETTCTVLVKVDIEDV